MQTGLVAGVAPGRGDQRRRRRPLGRLRGLPRRLGAGARGRLAALTVLPRRRPTSDRPVAPRVVRRAVRDRDDLAQLVRARDRAIPRGSSNRPTPRRSPPRSAAARESGATVKMVGTGHSFTAIGAPERDDADPRRAGRDRRGRPGRDDGHGPDRAPSSRTSTTPSSARASACTTWATSPSRPWPARSRPAPTAAAAAPRRSPHQVVGLELVTGTGELVRATADENPDVLEMARVGLGALGVLTSVTFRVEPVFVLEAHEQPMSWDEALATYDEMTATSDHVDMYWFPHTDRMLTKRNQRRGTDLSQARPLGRFKAWLDDDFLQNTVFGMLTAGANRAPRVIPRMNRIAAGLLSERTFSDVPHRVFTAERVGRLPRDGVRRAPRGRAGGARRGPQGDRRLRPADQLPGRDPDRARRRHPAVHGLRARVASTSRSTRTATPSTVAYFALLEPIMRAHDGRPHWGKVHTRTRRRPAADVPALRRLPGHARPARPGPGVRQRLPRPGPRRLKRPSRRGAPWRYRSPQA